MSRPLAATGLTKEYQEGRQKLRVLDDVNLHVAPGEMVAVVGASGAGKSTLLHILGLLDTPTKGEVRYGDSVLHKMGQQAQAHVRNRLFGFVFQFFHLFPDFDALENVMMPAMVGTPLPSWPAEKRRARTKASEILERVGLGARAKHRPAELSGGERQRVAIGRALVHDPEVLLLDEPTGNLDSKTGSGIMDVIHNLHEERKISIVMVTHDDGLARGTGRIVRLHDGKVVDGGGDW